MPPEFSTNSTGSFVNPRAYKVAVIPYGQYEIVICLTQDDRFVGIAEVRVSRDFLTPSQRVASSGYLDVEEYYRD